MFKKVLSIVSLITMFLLFNSVSISFAVEPIRLIEGIVTKVSDGDTIHILDANNTKVKIRMYGIDSPETEKKNKKTGRVSKPGQPYGEESFQVLNSKIFKKKIKLVGYEIDKYKRLVGMVWLNGKNINKEMVEEGNAWAYKQYLDPEFKEEFLKAEAYARKGRLGLWKDNNPEPPWDFRKRIKSNKIRR